MSATFTIKCDCGRDHVINPAQLLAQQPRTMTPARKAAQQKATEAAAAKRKKKVVPDENK